MIDGFIALYIFMLAAFTGYEVISRVPVILHTPLMSGSNFVHGIVLVGAMVAMGRAEGPLELTIAFFGVALAARLVAVGEERQVGEVHDRRSQRAQRGQQSRLAQGEWGAVRSGLAGASGARDAEDRDLAAGHEGSIAGPSRRPRRNVILAP